MERFITAITHCKGKKKSSLFVNDSLYAELYAADIRELGFSEGDAFTEEKENKLVSLLGIRAKKRTLNLLLLRDYSKGTLLERLKKDGYPSDVCEAAVAYAESYHYVDDLRYAMNQIRAMENRQSSSMISMKLMQKGIAKEQIEEAFEILAQERTELYGEAALTPEQIAIRRAVEQRLSGKETIPEEMREKLLASLLRKGFSYRDIKNVFSEYNADTSDWEDREL